MLISFMVGFLIGMLLYGLLFDMWGCCFVLFGGIVLFMFVSIGCFVLGLIDMLIVVCFL